MADATGNLTSQASYDSFGSQTGSIATRYGFTGREKDDATGLLFYRARWYDPKLGRFISEDPIGLAGGINQYSYVGNNPSNATDPLGLYEIDVHYYLTYYLAQKTGCFKDSQTRLLAEATQGTDEDPSTTPGLYENEKNSSYHALHPGAAEGFGSADLWRQATGVRHNYVGYGRYLHYLQDSFSHAGYESSNWGHGLGLGSDGLPGNHVTDKTYYDVAKTMRMAKSTYGALNRIAERECGCKGNNWDNSWDSKINLFAGMGQNSVRARILDVEGGVGGPLGHPIFADSNLILRKASILGVPIR